METMNAIDKLVTPDDKGRWVYRFARKGRTYCILPGGFSTIRPGSITVRVWPEGGAMRDVTVRDSDDVKILSRYANWAPGKEWPEASES